MTISTVYTPDTYAGDDSTDTFPITFEYLSTTTFVKVSIIVDSTGVITEKTAGTHYNITSDNVVFTAGNIPATGETVIIELNPNFKQESDYAENDNFPAETVEDDLDKRCLEGQINSDLVNRSVKFDASVTITGTTLGTIPVPTNAEDKYLKLNSDADGWEFFDLSDGSGIGNVVDDLTPQLGGDLDLNSNDITGTGTINITGTVTSSGAISGTTITGSSTITGTVLNATADTNQVVLDSDGTYTTTLTATATSSSKTVTIPNATDTLVGKATTDTLTNKTIDADGTGNVITNIGSSEIKSELITGQSDVAVATGDYIIYSDVSDSNNLKKHTVQGVLDLVPADGTAVEAISVSLSGNQTIATGTWTKLQFDTEGFDTAGTFDSATNYRWTPTTSGYYLISLMTFIGTIDDADVAKGAIYKNGTLYIDSFANSAAAGNYVSMSATTIISMNGSTDYIEGYIWHNKGSNSSALAAGDGTYGCLLTGALLV